MSRYAFSLALVKHLDQEARDTLRDEIIPNVIEASRDTLEAMLAQDLPTQEAYEEARTQFVINQNGFSIELQAHGLAEDFDEGFGPYDMKPGLLAGRAYADIPIGGGRSPIQTREVRRRLGDFPVDQARDLLAKGGLRRSLGKKGRGLGAGVRRVSQNSPAGSWIHPGRDPGKYLAKLGDVMGDRLSDIVSFLLEEEE